MQCTMKYILVSAAFAFIIVVILARQDLTLGYDRDMQSSRQSTLHAHKLDHGVHVIGQKMERFDLNQAECRNLFPKLNAEINVATSRGHIGKVPKRDGEHGFVRVRIHNGNLYVINAGSDVHHRQHAILSSIYRAMITAPREEVIPNIEFTFCVNDHPQPNVWSLARSDAVGEVNNTWLMPDYGYWSWPEPQIGSVSEARDAISEQDQHWSWDEKIDKAVWRGTVHWNSDLRGQLINVSRHKSWSDIEELEWGRNDLTMADFCKYRFLIYTEGVTYSGRLKYQQLCRSVIITTKMQWRTFLSPAMIEDGFGQNIVVVKDDWSDLEDRIHWLQMHPQEAEKIADNSMRTFRHQYMANGAESCYWRELFRAWAQVTDAPGAHVGKELGVRWENFMLMGKLEWEKYA